jgi:hypothetical protein
MVRFLADGENGHRLERADGVHIGSIRGRAIRLLGLRSEEEAIEASVVIWRALDAALERQFPGWPRHDPLADEIRLAHDGAYEWITDGERPLARLLPPRSASSGANFALEFVMPSFASEGAMIAVAGTMVRALDEFRQEPRLDDGGADVIEFRARSGRHPDDAVTSSGRPRPGGGDAA